MLAEHPLVAAELVAVARRAAEHLTPPGDHVQPVLLRYSAGKQRRKQLVGLDSVIEGVDQPRERRLASGPFVERRHPGHPSQDYTTAQAKPRYARAMKGDRVEIVVAADDGSRTYEILATRAGRRVEITTGRGIVEVAEVTRTGEPVRRARFMASRVLALVEHPASETKSKREPSNDPP
jgi:hypothetical protein